MQNYYIPGIILAIAAGTAIAFWVLSDPSKKETPKDKPKSGVKTDNHFTAYPSEVQTFKLDGTAIDDDELIRFAWQQWRDNRDEIKTVSTVYHARHLLLELGHRVEPNKPCGCGHKH